MAKRLDFIVVSALLLIAAVPLIVLRNSVWFWNGPVMLAIGLVWAAVLGFWLAKSPRLAAARGAFTTRKPFWKTLLIVVFLFVLTIIAIYIPSRQNYWLGQDESYNLTAEGSYWHKIYEEISGRPLATIAGFVALQITPGHLEGLFWLSTALRLLTGLCLLAIVRLLLPESEMVALIAAILFIVNPSEILRLAVISFFPFYETLFFLSFAIWLYLVSYRTQRRWMLIAACSVLVITLLHYEASATLAIFAPLLIRLQGRPKRFALWAYAWLGTMILCGLRYVAFFLSAHIVYQAVYISGAAKTLPALFANLISLLLPFFSFWTTFKIGSLAEFGVFGLMAAILAVLALLLTNGKDDFLRGARRYLPAAAVAIVAFLMSISLFVIVLPHAAGSQEAPTGARFEFLASLPQSILWALLIGFVGSLLAKRFQRIWLVGITSIMVLIAVSSAYNFQAHTTVISPSLDTRYIDFNRLSSIFQQANKLMPPLAPNTAIFFQIKDEEVSPFGWDYHLHDLSCLMFGVPAYVGRYAPDTGWIVRTVSQRVQPDDPTAGLPTSPENYKLYNFPKVVTFGFDSDRKVVLRESPPAGEVHPAADTTLHSSEPCVLDKLRTSQPGAALPYLINNQP